MIVIYDWQTMPDFLAFALMPRATMLTAHLDDDATRVLAAVDPSTSSFLFHLNCTDTSRFPESRAALVTELRARGVRVLNANVTDISKRAVQARCARLGLPVTAAAPDGPALDRVIVKTNSNYGGEIERALPPDARERLGLDAPSETIRRAADYPVMTRNEIPALWWSDRSIVIERFVSNRDGRWYRAYVLGSRMVISEMENPAEVKKVGGSRMTRQWFVDDADDAVPAGDCPAALLAAVRAMRHDAQLDFGAMDVMVDDDRVPYVIDINSTPAYFFHVPGLVEFLGATSPPATSR